MKMHGLILKTFKITRKKNKFVDMYMQQKEKEEAKKVYRELKAKKTNGDLYTLD